MSRPAADQRNKEAEKNRKFQGNLYLGQPLPVDREPKAFCVMCDTGKGEMKDKQKRRGQKQSVNQLNQTEHRPDHQQQAHSDSRGSSSRAAQQGGRAPDLEDESLPANDRSSGGMDQQK